MYTLTIYNNCTLIICTTITIIVYLRAVAIQVLSVKKSQKSTQKNTQRLTQLKKRTQNSKFTQKST